MNITFKTIGFSSSAGVKEALERELSRVEKIFKPETLFDSCIKKTKIKNDTYYKCDISIKNGRNFIRGYGESTNVIDSIDKAVDSLIRKARKIKTVKIKKRYEYDKLNFNSVYNEFNDEEIALYEEGFGKVIKEKDVFLTLMSPEEAVIQMELLSHNFFMFLNEIGNPCVIYKANDNEYGLLRSV